MLDIAGPRFLKLILSVDALTPPLSGIGRYTWELASRIGQVQGVEKIRFFRGGRWVDDPAALLKKASRGHRYRFKFPRWAKDWYWQRACRGQVFHAPNYFLPHYVENGVATIHDLSVLKFPETHPVERVRQFEKSFRQTLDVAAHLITDSESTRMEVIEFLGWPSEKITAVHLGVSSRFVPGSTAALLPTSHRYGLNPGGYSLCVSTIEPRKRIDSLLTAYSCLPEKLRVAYPLILVGGAGWHSEHLHQAINAGQSAGWIRYLGFVPEDDLPALYAGARLFVYPSSYEGFGLPVAEAMASGVPVVTSDCSCLPEITSGAAKMVDPDDVENLIATIKDALTDTAWRQEAIAKGLQVAGRYNWDECVRRTVEVYKASNLGMHE